MERIIEEGYSDEYGVRPLRQTIVKYVDDPMSETLLHRKIAQGSTLLMDLDLATGQVVVCQVRHGQTFCSMPLFW